MGVYAMQGVLDEILGSGRIAANSPSETQQISGPSRYERGELAVAQGSCAVRSWGGVTCLNEPSGRKVETWSPRGGDAAARRG